MASSLVRKLTAPKKTKIVESNENNNSPGPSSDKAEMETSASNADTPIHMSPTQTETESKGPLVGQLFHTPNAVACNLQRCLSSISRPWNNGTHIQHQPVTTNMPSSSFNNNVLSSSSSLLRVCLPFVNSIRTAVRYSRRKGKPKTVRSVPARFFRLDWGIYIRPRAGRNKHKWKKPDWIVERGRYHVFCNKQQSRLLDKMTTKYWKKKRHYVDDPYAPYYKRTGMPGDYTPPKYLP